MRPGRTALVVAVAALVATPIAAAHPQATSSVPAPDALLQRSPDAVTIEFSEVVEPVGDAISVTGPTGAAVATGPATGSGRSLRRDVSAVDRGTYLVRWQVIGEDTHPARGAFLFSVGERTSTGVPGVGQVGITMQVLARWLSIVGVALGFGVPFVALIALGAAITSREWRLVMCGILLLLVAEPIGLLGQTATLAPGSSFDPDLIGDVLRTSYGHAAGLRLGVGVGLWALVAATRQTAARQGLLAIVVLGAAACVVEAMSLHRIESLPGFLGLAIGSLHVAGVATWLACVVLALYGRPAAALAPPASGALLVAVVTGSGLALAHLERPFDLVETSYGVVLLGKLALVAAAIVLGGLAARQHGTRRLELAIAAIVLALGATLASIVPPL